MPHAFHALEKDFLNGRKREVQTLTSLMAELPKMVSFAIAVIHYGRSGPLQPEFCKHPTLN